MAIIGGAAVVLVGVLLVYLHSGSPTTKVAQQKKTSPTVQQEKQVQENATPQTSLKAPKEFEGKPLSHWRARAEDTSPKFRIEAADALSHLGDTLTLVGLLHDDDPAVRTAAFAGLEQIGTKAVPALCEVLRGDDSKAQALLRDLCNIQGTRGIAVLSRLKPATNGAIPILTKLLRDEDPRVSFNAAVALGLMGPAAEDTIPILTKMLRDENPRLRFNAAMALGSMGLAAQDAIPALTELLRDKTSTVRGAAADALGSMGPAAKDAIPILSELLDDKDEVVREEATYALAKIKPEQTRKKTFRPAPGKSARPHTTSGK
jgi:HEAT repeat protein